MFNIILDIVKSDTLKTFKDRHRDDRLEIEITSSYLYRQGMTKRTNS